MAQFYNAFGGTTIQGTTLLDRFFAFTKDENFDHVRADAVIPTFTWTTSIINLDGSFYTITGVNVQISLDVYFSNGGTDVLYGSNLNDAIFYNNGAFADGVGGINGIQQFYLGQGDDIADFSAHGVGGVSYAKQVLIHGEDGNDTIVGGANNDELFGDAGNDFIVGNAGGDTLDGGDGDDFLYGDDTGGNLVGGQDLLRGKAGNDQLFGGANRDRLEGGDGNDILRGAAGDDTIFGGNDNDIIYGDEAGGIGGDVINGDAGDDQIFGIGGIDQIDGGVGADFIDGGEGNDIIRGSADNDRIIGGTGNDTIDGGTEVDTAVFAGNRADYLIRVNPDGSFQITDSRSGATNEGIDTVRNVEFFEFADGTVAAGNLNHPPVITSNGGGASGTAVLDENTTAVTTVTATDEDTGQTISFGIAGGADAALFSIDPVTGVLSFISAPDFENPIDADHNGVYDVIVRAFDGGAITTQQLAVTVNDVIDGSPPIITSNGGGDTGTADVNENTTVVTTVTATDLDGPVTTYRIVGGADAPFFAIDATTGVLSFINAPDFENAADAGGNNVYNVIVEASDGNNADRQALSVNVKNVNDNAPVIVSSAAFSLNENSLAAGTVAATDADATIPGFAPTYAIVGGLDAALFNLDAATGALTFKNAPNYEAPLDADGNNIYEVLVQASDGTFSVQQAVTINVNNINDNAPVITTNGGGAAAAISVAENGAAVTTVQASDADGAVPAYRISGGADAGFFTINAVTGVLTFIVAPDFETPLDANLDNHYLVTVEASDGTLIDTQDLDITVTDVLDTGRTITGTAANDTITPTAAVALRTTALSDTIYGLAGNDTIDGGGGADIMDGGAGNDTYTVDTYSDDGSAFNDDRVVELAGGGVDRVNASVTYRLAAEVENLTLLGTAAIGGTGNILANQMIGNSGANTLSGDAGNDTILGNDGDDIISGDDGDDSLVGGNGVDILRGGLGNDRIDGSAGADILQGDSGNDTYIVDTYVDDAVSTNDDFVIESALGGTDIVNASVTYRLTGEVENLTLTGTAVIDGYGNTLANTINGNNSDNLLSGLDGNDTINGLGGNDTLLGGTGSDTIDGGIGNDNVQGGDASDTLRGSAGLDVINGGTGKDLLTGGTEADTFVFAFGDTTINTNLDRIVDFVGSTGDRIDLDAVTGPVAAANYDEATITTAVFADALALAKTKMNTTVKYVFIAGTTDGWLFWDGAGADGLPDQAIQMTGVTNLSLFGSEFLI